MASTIFNALLREQVDVFRAAFSKTATDVFYDPVEKKLRHAGEYGVFRESIVRDFMKFLVPRNLDMSSGFVITAKDSVSTQVDVVVFDAGTTPLYIGGDRQRFFPVESVFCIGEVKSNLKKNALKDALNKLAAVKRLSEEMLHPSRKFDSKMDPRDLMPSFLICQKFDFDHTRLEHELDEMYGKDIEHRHKHNFILSIDDGLLCYVSDNFHLPYPAMALQNKKHRFLLPGESQYAHFNTFSTFMYMVTITRSRYIPSLSDYLGPPGGPVRDQS
ncbi:DUF6602 domain-containing protein [Verminephrobacter aporrectodeae]|uniref:DUF6602 domain-containing protein n=1 Tax=Verminephrobacter aporrectodeae TaxID=1110389 RepID=UPI0011104EA9|nr:DUF6602 domain-containing protein [Verminephrobacter aporrectodeae]